VKVQDIAEVLAAVVMEPEEFKELENTIIEQVKDGGRFAGDIAEDLGFSQIMLRSLVKRSTKLDYRGHRVEISE
jgi:predicted DNA-binding ArsR family transcriptional regulator